MNFKSYISPVNETSFSEWGEKFLDNNVIFSFKYTKIHNTFCIWKSKALKQDLQAFYNTLWEKEGYTWNIFFKKPKSSWWLERENTTSSNYLLMHAECPKLNKFWHFYIKNNSNKVWRIFWWYDYWIFYIIFIDINWKINRKSHK